MLLVVRGGLGIPQIVRVTADEEWIGVLGIGKDRIVNAESKQVLHVCQEGDVFEDVGVVVENGKLVKYTAASEAQIEKLGPPASREEIELMKSRRPTADGRQLCPGGPNGAA